MDILNLFFNPILQLLPKLPEVLIDLVVGYFVIMFLIWILKKALKILKIPKLRGIIVSISRLTLWLILIIFIANNLGFNKLAIAISGTVLVLAFLLNTGVGPLITDVVSGIFLCTDPDFVPGSRVKIGSGDNATEGMITLVDMRKVRIIDDNGKTHVFPNSVVDKDQWTVIEKKSSALKAKTMLAKEKAKEIIKKKINK